MATNLTVRHRCMIYDGPPSRTLPVLVTLIRHNLAAGMRCMYMNSPAMVAGLRSQLYASGLDVDRELARGALVLAYDQNHLVDRRFVRERMIQLLQDAVEEAIARGFAGLFATGDMTWEFGPEKDFSKLLDYEFHLEQLFGRQPLLSGICQYHRDLLPKEAVREGVVSHEGLFINETLTRLNPHYVKAKTPADWKVAAHPELESSLDALLALEP